MLSSCNYPSFQTRSFSNKPPGILFLRPDISLQTKAKRPDTTNVFRNLLNDSRIENEIKKKEREKRKWKKKKKKKKKAQGGSQRTEETKLLLLLLLSFRVSRYYRWSHVGAQRPIIVFPPSSSSSSSWRDEKTSSWMILPAMNLRGKLSRIMHTFRRSTDSSDARSCYVVLTGKSSCLRFL